MNKDHGIISSFHWVKGHQDQNKNVKELSIEVRLNIAADSYASQWQEDHVGSYFPIPHEYPSSQAMLIIQNQAITNKYRYHLICADTEPRYIEYLQEKNGWSDNTVQAIAWKSLSLGITRINRPVVVSKICNKILFTAVNLKKWNWQSYDSCSVCKQRETMEHMIQCPDPSQNEWQRTYILEL